jgi:hypothetical protein
MGSHGDSGLSLPVMTDSEREIEREKERERERDRERERERDESSTLSPNLSLSPSSPSPSPSSLSISLSRAKLDLDVIFFDESIDAKYNRYMFRWTHIDTPFLQHTQGKHYKTYVPPTPHTLDLDKKKIIRYEERFPRLE